MEKVFLFKRTGTDAVTINPEIDFWMEDAMATKRPYCPPETMDSEDIMFFLYTSGSTGAPKGVAHTTAGYMLYASLTHKYVFDYKPGDVYACKFT